jgi:hypothetical protein
MSTIARTALALLALSLTLISFDALSDPPARVSALATGSTEDRGISKIIWLQAVQTVPGSLDATGSALMMQADPTQVFGDFALLASVVCLRAAGPRVTAGLRLVWGLGNALGHAGEMFYVVVESGYASGSPDLLDNGGYSPGAPDCNVEIGVPGSGSPFVAGGVVLNEVP